MVQNGNIIHIKVIILFLYSLFILSLFLINSFNSMYLLLNLVLSPSLIKDLNQSFIGALRKSSISLSFFPTSLSELEFSSLDSESEFFLFEL